MTNPAITSTITTTARNPQALKSILSTVSKGAQSVGAFFDAGTKSVGMMDRFVTKKADEQELRYRKDKRAFVHNLVREAAEEQAIADMRVVEFCKQSDEHKNLFNEAYGEFEALFAEELGKASSSSAS